MDDLARAVLAHVDPRELIDLAGALIRIPSFKTEETPVARFLADFFSTRGYDVELQEIEPGRFQTIATLRGTGGGASLMLNGHTDINALTRRWRRDPWTPSLEGDRLYGHGVQNMKGGLASIVMAAEAVRRSGVRLAGDLVVACVAGETQGGEGTHYLMERGFRTDAAVVAEPFGADHLVTVHSGIVHLAIHTYGITGHIGRLEGTVNDDVDRSASPPTGCEQPATSTDAAIRAAIRITAKASGPTRDRWPGAAAMLVRYRRFMHEHVVRAPSRQAKELFSPAIITMGLCRF